MGYGRSGCGVRRKSWRNETSAKPLVMRADAIHMRARTAEPVAGRVTPAAGSAVIVAGSDITAILLFVYMFTSLRQVLGGPSDLWIGRLFC